MNTAELERHYGDKSLAMKAVGCKSRQLWRNWSLYGIPYMRQRDIELLTDGKLRAKNGKGKK